MKSRFNNQTFVPHVSTIKRRFNNQTCMPHVSTIKRRFNNQTCMPQVRSMKSRLNNRTRMPQVISNKSRFNNQRCMARVSRRFNHSYQLALSPNNKKTLEHFTVCSNKFGLNLNKGRCKKKTNSIWNNLQEVSLFWDLQWVNWRIKTNCPSWSVSWNLSNPKRKKREWTAKWRFKIGFTSLTYTRKQSPNPNKNQSKLSPNTIFCTRRFPGVQPEDVQELSDTNSTGISTVSCATRSTVWTAFLTTILIWVKGAWTATSIKRRLLSTEEMIQTNLKGSSRWVTSSKHALVLVAADGSNNLMMP